MFIENVSKKPWTLNGLKTLIRKTDDCGSNESCPGSGRPCTVHVAADIADVEDLVLSQDNDPQVVSMNCSSNTHFQEFGAKNYPQRFASEMSEKTTSA